MVSESDEMGRWLRRDGTCKGCGKRRLFMCVHGLDRECGFCIDCCPERQQAKYRSEESRMASGNLWLQGDFGLGDLIGLEGHATQGESGKFFFRLTGKRKDEMKKDNREVKVAKSGTEFRPLNQLEKNTIFAAATAKEGIDQKTGLPYQSRIPADDLRHVHHNHLRVSYERMQGGFTVCILVLQLFDPDSRDEGEVKTYLWRGVSRRSYKDARKPIRGEMVAFHRAIMYSRPVTV